MQIAGSTVAGESATPSATRGARRRRRSTTRADEVYQRLRADILDVRYQPGDQLDEDTLAATYGVSRTPVREALRRLASDDLVTLRPHRGASVAQMSLVEVGEIEQICELVEPLAARQAAGRMAPAVLDELRAQLDACETENPTHDDYIRYMQLDLRLHEAILDAAGNATMRDIVTRLHRRMNAVRLIANRHRYDQSLAEHRRVLAAIAAGDGDAAMAAMLHHIHQRVRRQHLGPFAMLEPNGPG